MGSIQIIANGGVMFGAIVRARVFFQRCQTDPDWASALVDDFSCSIIARTLFCNCERILAQLGRDAIVVFKNATIWMSFASAVAKRLINAGTVEYTSIAGRWSYVQFNRFLLVYVAGAVVLDFQITSDFVPIFTRFNVENAPIVKSFSLRVAKRGTDLGTGDLTCVIDFCVGQRVVRLRGGHRVLGIEERLDLDSGRWSENFYARGR